MAFSCSGMKQDLQNLRDEIKQLGREIRAELKGELQLGGPQTDPSLWFCPAPGLWGVCDPERPEIYPGHTAGLDLESSFQFIVLSMADVFLSGSFICNETIYSYYFCCPVCILWAGRWDFC